MDLSWMFKLRGPVTSQQRLIFGIVGFLILLLIWIGLSSGENPIIENGILPKPFSDCQTVMVDKTYVDQDGKTVTEQVSKRNNSVYCAFGDLYKDSGLFKNLCLSLGFNFGGYIKALLWSLPFAFLIGLFPLFNATFQSQIDAYRFIPLTAVTGIFVSSFGIGTPLKINFLAFGIMIYLVPVIIQRISEVQDVYVKTVYTLGASKWQTIKSVYIPAVLSKLSDDVRVLTAISWTYIIVAEGIGDQGGLGSLIYKSGKRMGRPDKVFAILIIFILIGLIQDRVFLYLDKKFFPHKYQVKDQYSSELKKEGTFELIIDYILKASVWIGLGIYVILTLDEMFGVLGNINLISHLFEDTCWVVHTIFLSIIFFKTRKYIEPFLYKKPQPKTA